MFSGYRYIYIIQYKLSGAPLHYKHNSKKSRVLTGTPSLFLLFYFTPLHMKIT